MTRLSVFIAASVDGYIATSDDRIDWLEAAARADEDYGYDSFIASVDALAMGRGTYDHIAHLDPLPFGERAVFVFTHNPPPDRHGVTFWDASPRQALQHWSSAGLQRVYVDGGRLISSFLAEGLIDDLLLTTVPVLLGTGRPLFHPVSRGAHLTLESTQSWPSGMVNRLYIRTDDGPAATD